jgi:YVTN family beta-propeller protein
MHSKTSNGSRVAWTRGFMAALFAFMLVVELGAMAPPAEAAPLAYVVNSGDGTVSVIDTATNTVVGIPIPVGREPFGVAVIPDGKHAYVANRGSNNVSVIDTATNMVVATVVVGNVPFNVAVTPDGNHAYVANAGSSNVSVIDTAANTVGPTVIVVGNAPVSVAVTRTGNAPMSRISSPTMFR